MTVEPGGLLVSTLRELGWTQTLLARRTGLTTKHISFVCTGKAPITPRTALLFEQELGVPAEHWLAAEIDRTLAILRARPRWDLIDLADERRLAKDWLPEDDRDVSSGLVTVDDHGKPACTLHGAMNRVDQHTRIYRCMEHRCGLGAELIKHRETQ